MPRPPKRKPGRSLSEEERAAAGRERLQLRPRVGARALLDELADRWRLSPSDAATRAFELALERD